MITIQITQRFPDVKVSLPKIKKLVKSICELFKLSNATVSIAIVNDIQMRRVNARFAKSAARRTTDCLSFDLSDSSGRPDGQWPECGKSFELIVNGQLAIKEADLRGHSSEAELALYITHGLLHNLGFDDSTPKKAKAMHNKEDEILRQFGYGSVYNKSA